MSREKGCALFLVFAFTMAVAPDAMAKKKKKSSDTPASGASSGSSKGGGMAAALSGGGGSEAVDRGDKFYDTKNYYMASIEYNKTIEDQNGDELSK